MSGLKKRSLDSATEEELTEYFVEWRATGNQYAFNCFWEEMQMRLTGYVFTRVRNLEATQDIVGDTALKVIRYADSYKQNSKASTWVIKIAKNCLIDYIRREKRRAHDSLDEKLQVESKEPGVHEQVQSEHDTYMLQDIFEAALEVAPGKAKSVLALRMQEAEYTDIADALGIPEGTVKSQLSHARRRLSWLKDYARTGNARYIPKVVRDKLREAA